jgi:hypothetical protein
MTTDATAARFWAKVITGPGCWQWDGTLIGDLVAAIEAEARADERDRLLAEPIMDAVREVADAKVTAALTALRARVEGLVEPDDGTDSGDPADAATGGWNSALDAVLAAIDGWTLVPKHRGKHGAGIVEDEAEIARLRAALYGADEALRALVNAGWSSLSEMRAIAAADDCTAALGPEAPR